MKPYQERIIQEYSELDKKLHKLARFIGSDPFYMLDEDERSRLMRQHIAMAEYRAILSERIEAFS